MAGEGCLFFEPPRNIERDTNANIRMQTNAGRKFVPCEIWIFVGVDKKLYGFYVDIGRKNVYPTIVDSGGQIVSSHFIKRAGAIIGIVAHPSIGFSVVLPG